MGLQAENGFLRKSIFEKYFFYTIDYLEGLNGYILNVQKNISYGLKIHDLMGKLVAEGFINDENSSCLKKQNKDKEDRDSRVAVNDEELKDNEEINNKGSSHKDKKGLFLICFLMSMIALKIKRIKRITLGLRF